jgi:hypothetical protein
MSSLSAATQWLPSMKTPPPPTPSPGGDCLTTTSDSDSTVKSKSHYDRRSVGQSVLVSSPIWGPTPDFCYSQTFAVLSMWDDLSDERTGLSFLAVIISSTWHLYLQLYLSAFYTFLDICQESGSLWIYIIYSFICNCSIYVCTIYTRP